MQPLDYETFVGKCVEDLKTLQSKFQEQYDLNWYENWFYNQATSLLTFSTDQAELNFKYFQVGSYSEKSKTWLWSWANNHTPDKVKEITKLIKDFGEKSGYPKLTNGYFESEDFEAWEFTAIAAHLTNAIGAYRPVSEQLQIFLVITEFIDNDTAQNIKDKYIECSEHEYRRITFVCQHLNHKTKVGFNEPFETFEDMDLADDKDLQAWCDQCENVREREGEWNDESIAFANMKIVCEKCYFKMKALNLGT